MNVTLSARRLSRCFLSALAVWSADLPAQIPSTGVALTAVSAGPKQPFPSAAGDFELSTLARGAFQYMPTFAPWSFGNGTGIASNGSGFTSLNPNAPGPIRVAFVQGGGEISVVHTFDAGAWRLCFRGAQRERPSGTNRQVVRITVGSTQVFEAELRGSDYEVYRTRAFSFATASTVTVSIKGLNPHGGDNTALLDQFELEPIGAWNEPSTWSPSVVPTANNAVTIPAGVEVAMTGDMYAKSVTSMGELLALPADSRLETQWVAAMSASARFEVGQQGTPFAEQFTLYLNASDPNQDPFGAGTKHLMVMGGAELDMHGSPKRHWTKLKSLVQLTVFPPVSEITVDDPSAWQVGDEIVVAYTGHVSHTAGPTGCSFNPYQQPRSRKATIDGISGAGALRLSELLDPADHCFAAAVSYTNPSNGQSWLVDQRAEVGMLSHNVRIEGSPTPVGLGAHVMIMAANETALAGIARIAHVEFTNVGQHQRLGRYPMHWHMVRESGAGQYLRNCSVHGSHNRAITGARQSLGRSLRQCLFRHRRARGVPRRRGRTEQRNRRQPRVGHTQAGHV